MAAVSLGSNFTLVNTEQHFSMAVRKLVSWTLAVALLTLVRWIHNRSAYH
jgi:hypothetical protein